jgi:hypothetical protein
MAPRLVVNRWITQISNFNPDWTFPSMDSARVQIGTTLIVLFFPWALLYEFASGGCERTLDEKAARLSITREVLLRCTSAGDGVGRDGSFSATSRACSAVLVASAYFSSS